MTQNDFYRYCRLVHGWLSALAFIALCFLSFTGLLLNHPDWFSTAPISVAKQNFELTEAEAAQLRAAAQRSPLLIDYAASRTTLRGTLDEEEAEGDAVGNEIFVRLRGIRGTSFLRADLSTRSLEVTVEESSKLSMLNELHRGERAGKIWRGALDIIAIILIALSLIGYLIFLGMSGSRTRTALLLTLASTLGLSLLFVYAVT